MVKMSDIQFLKWKKKDFVLFLKHIRLSPPYFGRDLLINPEKPYIVIKLKNIPSRYNRTWQTTGEGVWAAKFDVY